MQHAPERLGELAVVAMVAREDPALGDLARQVLEERGQRLRGHPAGHAVVDVDLPVPHRERVQRAAGPGTPGRSGTRAPGAPAAARPAPRPRRTPGACTAQPGISASSRTSSWTIRHWSRRSSTCRHSRPSARRSGSSASCQRADLLQERPLREVEVGVEVLPEVLRKDDAHRRPEDLLEVEVDGARRPVVVDVRVHVEARVQEHDERLRPAPVERQPLRREEAVVDDPVEIGPTATPHMWASRST